MNYNDLIEQWFYRAMGEGDPFTRYIFLYISFIAFLSQANRNETDRRRINRVKRDREARGFYLDLIERDGELRADVSNLVLELRQNPIRSIGRNDRSWRGTNGVLDGVEDWENLVEFWYRVRNNLFHGHKAPEFARDRRLVNHAYITLLPFMRNFINHDLVWEFD